MLELYSIKQAQRHEQQDEKLLLKTALFGHHTTAVYTAGTECILGIYSSSCTLLKGESSYK